ncbi:DUF1707 SHOCT-like domain-containing protein [Amycolatopsis anabasis]|uniref:DUF1707 SHOCT-like domain-containing protein n=1 Tax=Amycolatopsis anabasis TaxID=1840409 RepID=UPI00131A7D7D|nr:DUF1707 domain-containing protein [Amycolatopsis anabasis]
MTGLGGDPANLRVSDAEREHVVSLLNKATGRGLLDLDEFTTRTDLALAARTRGELNWVLIDLPGLVRTAAPESGERLELREAGSAITRRGAWAVPKVLVLHPKHRTVRVDFTEARIDHRVVRIELHGGATQVRLWLPEGATIDIDGLWTKRKPAQVRDRGGFVGSGGTPHFVLAGRAANGMVSVLPPPVRS